MSFLIRWIYLIKMKNNTTIDAQEVSKFAEHANHWWDPQGPLKTLHDINPLRLEFIAKYVDWQDLHILDVGCGGGLLSEGMALRGAHVIGIDVESEALETARAHAIMSNLKIDYLCEPIELYSAPKFDAITCLEMLEHVADPNLVIQHCARQLKPGGYLFLSTLNRTPKAYVTAIVAAEYIFSLLPRQTHDYKKFIKPSELAAFVRAAGLEVVDLQGMFYNPLTRIASLWSDVAVNYLMVARLPA